MAERLLAERVPSEAGERERFLAPDFDRDTHNPFLFSQMERVVGRIGEARERGETIGLFGDYDADGVTSSVIMHTALTALGIPVSVYIPEKTNEGHGFNLNAVAQFRQAGAKLALTLDCGMTNHTEILAAKQAGIETIIVDHHHVPATLPEAYAIVNPKLPAETYPFRELCGAGTSFKVAQALYARYLPEEQEQLKWLLDVVATGTVADVMPLVGENRVIVKYGLIVLSKTRRVGFQEMFAVGGMKIGEGTLPDAHTVGFQIAPRINAASRMAHALQAFRLLTETDPVQARLLALDLEALNTARQKVSADTTELVRKVAADQYRDRKFIFAVSEHFPFGIVGLVAGRIANEFRKPTCVLTKGETTSQGSFRSIPEFDIIEALEKCGDLLVKYGGHAQAAGMTIKNENLEKFYEMFSALVEQRLQTVVTEPELLIDMRIQAEHITPELCADLALFAPFGEGNREPVFLTEGLSIEEARLVGNGNKHWKLKLSAGDGSARRFDAIGFSLGTAHPSLAPGALIDAVYTLSENTWNGRTSLQLKLVDLKER